MDLITVVIATYGSREWIDLALQRAMPSAQPQAPTIHVHRETLHDARNTGLGMVDTPFVVFLDADDELEPGYVATMARGSADLRAPAVRYVRNGRERAPYVPKVAGHHHECAAECIASGAGNWLVVGTCARTELLHEAGGWRDWPVYEDFDLWMRAIAHGATVEAIPDAVYRAHVRADSRNRAPAIEQKNRVHHDIVASIMGEQAAA